MLRLNQAKPEAKKPKSRSLESQKPSPKPETREQPSDLTPQIAKRAYELYEEARTQGQFGSSGTGSRPKQEDRKQIAPKAEPKARKQRWSPSREFKS